MSKAKQEKELIGPWRKLHGAVWLIGLAIIAWQDWWWPGILVLVAISMVLEAALMQFAPQAFEKAETQTSPPPSEGNPPTSPSPQPIPASPLPTASTGPVIEHRLELLPSVCPKCGGPIRGHEVTWTGQQSADCPYCGANLPMRRD
jgi:hypothetical protein